MYRPGILMRDLIIHGLTVFMGFFAIMNPIANTPVFLGLTQGYNEKTSRLVARKSVSLAFVIVCVFSIGGKLIFDVFGITLDAFRITGGLLVTLIGFHMLHGQQSDIQQSQEGEQVDDEQVALSIAVSPLAMPILAGPGTIATAMNFSAGGGTAEIVLTLFEFGLLCLLTYWFFMRGGDLVSKLGNEAMGVISKMMGLLIAVIGVQMVIHGLGGVVESMK